MKKQLKDSPTNFAKKIAKVMDDLKSSHVYFIIQEAYGDISWEEAQELLNHILKYF